MEECDTMDIQKLRNEFELQNITSEDALLAELKSRLLAAKRIEEFILVCKLVRNKEALNKKLFDLVELRLKLEELESDPDVAAHLQRNKERHVLSSLC